MCEVTLWNDVLWPGKSQYSQVQIRLHREQLLEQGAALQHTSTPEEAGICVNIFTGSLTHLQIKEECLFLPLQVELFSTVFASGWCPSLTFIFVIGKRLPNAMLLVCSLLPYSH